MQIHQAGCHGGLGLLAITAISAITALTASQAQGVPGAEPANPAAPMSGSTADARPHIRHELHGIDAHAANDVWAVGTACSDACESFYSNHTWVQHYDGSTWSHVPSFTHPGQSEELVAVSEISPDDVWAVGNKVKQGGGEVLALAEHWDGTSWSGTPIQGSAVLDVLGLSSDDVWAVGNLGIHHWDGTRWHSSPFEAPPKSTFSEFNSIAAFAADDIWAVGTYQSSTDFVYHPLAEHWDGRHWTYVKTPAPHGDTFWTSVNGSGPDDIWAVGDADYNTKTVAAHWDGHAWVEVATPMGGLEFPQLNGVVTLSPDNAWLVGDNEPLDGPTVTLVEHWNGTAWKVVSTPNGQGSSSLQDVGAVSGTDMWAVGTDVFRRPHALREHYDGSTWTIR